MKPITETVSPATNIRIMLQVRGMTVADLAARSGVSKSTLSRYLNDKTDLVLSSLTSLCSALDMPIWVILGVDLDKYREHVDSVDFNEILDQRIKNSPTKLTARELAEVIEEAWTIMSTDDEELEDIPEGVAMGIAMLVKQREAQSKKWSQRLTNTSLAI